MLYLSTAQTTSKNEVYKSFIDKLSTEGDKEAVIREIRELCEGCRSPSPIMCVELCKIWKLKQEYQDAFTTITSKPSLTDLLNKAKNTRRLKLLEILIEKPCSLKELRNKLKKIGYSCSLTSLRSNYVKPLVEVELVRKEGEVYTMTFKGKSIYNILTNSEIAELPLHSKGHEEKILKDLLSGPKTYHELKENIPRGFLYRSLKRLQSRNFIVKSILSGSIFYFATKRRPTRKLSSTEMKIFKALPKEGVSVGDLSEKVGISIRRVYKYLRKLRYKRHVKKEKKSASYRLTEKGKRLAKSLNMAYNIL